MARGVFGFLLFLAMAGCGKRSAIVAPEGTAPGIVGGRDVMAPNDYSKHVVFLQMRMGNGAGFCTGSILDSQTILTAGHCLTGGGMGVILFTTNAHAGVSATMVRRIDNAEVYPQFHMPRHQQSENHGDDGDVPSEIPGPDQVPTVQQIKNFLDLAGNVDYDIGLLHFSGGLPPGYSPVQLATSADVLTPGISMHFIGFGISRVNAVQTQAGKEISVVPAPDHTTVGTLRETDVPMSDYDIALRMLFSSGTKSSVCSGDSGGPAFVKDSTGAIVQVGIAEAVASAYCNSVSTHTAIFPYLDWIKQTSEKMAEEAAVVSNTEAQAQK